MKRPTLRRLREYSPRDMVVVGIPLFFVVFAGFWLASRYIQPAPPDTLILSTGGEGGAYQRFAAAYKDILAQQGIRLVERPSAGSLENLARLRDPASDVDAGFVQGGAARVQGNDGLFSLGMLDNEPLWIFYRAELGPLTQLTELRGARLAIGPEGSGSRHLALELFHANRLEPQQLKLRKQAGPELASAFMRGQIDAAFAVGPVESSTIWTLLHTPGLRLLNLSQAEAYTRQFPYLSRLILPRGAIDLATDSPPQDIHLLATQATLVVRDSTHPALVSLLMQALSETHDKPGIFRKTGEYPRAASADFPLAPEAERYYKSGKPLLQRYLPFWAATLVDRMIVMLIPLFAILIPLLRVAPGMYNWRIKSRIYRRYGELKFIEVELEAEPGKLTRAEWHQRVDAIEHDVNHMSMPLTFSDMVYTLRMHIGLVRKAIDRTVTVP